MDNNKEHSEQKTDEEIQPRHFEEQKQYVSAENIIVGKEKLDQNEHEYNKSLENEDKHNTDLSENQTASDNKDIEIIDIDEFLIRTKECGLSQFAIVLGMMLVTFTLAYTPFIFYFIGFDPHWIDNENGTAHYREDSSRCFLNESEWRYDYEKTTVVTEVKIFF